MAKAEGWLVSVHWSNYIKKGMNDYERRVSIVSPLASVDHANEVISSGYRDIPLDMKLVAGRVVPDSEYADMTPLRLGSLVNRFTREGGSGHPLYLPCDSGLERTRRAVEHYSPNPNTGVIVLDFRLISLRDAFQRPESHAEALAEKLDLHTDLSQG